MIFDHLDYREYLKEVLAEKAQKDSGYSLRRLARYFRLPASVLSEVISGKRKLSEEATIRIGDVLALNPESREYLRLLVQLDRARTSELREVVLADLQRVHPRKGQVHDLTVDLFKTISDWHHFALLSLLEIEGYEWNSEAAAAALGVHKYDVESAIQRLERLQLVQLVNGRPRVSHEDLRVESLRLPNDALRKYHAQMLEKAKEALITQGPEERYTATENFVLTPPLMGRATEIMEDCFRKMRALTQEASRTENPEVSGAQAFHLGINLFRLTNIPTKKSKPHTEIKKTSPKGNPRHANS